MCSFDQNMGNEKMEDAYYLEIIANDQLRDTPAYLLSILLEIVSAVVR